MTKTFTKFAAFAAPLALLAACGEEPAPEPVATETVAPEPLVELAAPDEELFTTLWADTCPDAEAVGQAFCQRGMGAEFATCEFALGDDEYTRNDARLEIDETGESWMIADGETLCTEAR